MNQGEQISISHWANQNAKNQNLPLSVLAEMTYACNQGCYYCYNLHERKSEISASAWISIFDQLKEMGTLYLTISGGEPFCRQDIRQILSAASARTFAISVISNGTMIDSETALFLSALGILEAGISFHALNPDLHDRLAELPGSFDKARNALKLLISSGIRTVVKHTVTSENFGEYHALSRFAEEEGAGFEADSIVFPPQEHAKSPFSISEEQHQIFLEFMELHPSPSFDSGNLHCDAGRSVMGINPYGEIVPCVQLPLVFGNATKEPISKIWHSAKAANFRASEEKEGQECSCCSMKSTCARCPGLSLMETGAWEGGSPSVCLRATVLEAMIHRK